MASVIDLRRRAVEDTDETIYTCSAAARWFPRLLAAVWLAAGLIVAAGLAEASALPFAKGVQWTVMAAGAVLGVWTLRGGREAGVRVTVSRSRVMFANGTRESGVEFEDIERFATDLPLAESKHLFPATVVRDYSNVGWRLPAVLTDGDRLVREIVDRAGRDDLRTWMETLRLERRMAYPRLLLACGYAFAGLVLAASVGFYLT